MKKKHIVRNTLIFILIVWICGSIYEDGVRTFIKEEKAQKEEEEKEIVAQRAKEEIFPIFLEKIGEVGFSDLELEYFVQKYEKNKKEDEKYVVSLYLVSEKLGDYYDFMENTEKMRELYEIMCKMDRAKEECKEEYEKNILRVNGIIVEVDADARMGGDLEIWSRAKKYSLNQSYSESRGMKYLEIEGEEVYCYNEKTKEESFPFKDKKLKVKQEKSVTSRSKIKKTTKDISSIQETKREDYYNVYDYYDPEDFYEDYEDDFDGYEDAEEYYEDAWND